MKKGTLTVVSVISGAVAGFFGSMHFMKQKKTDTTKINKFKGYYNMLNQWLMLKQEGRSLAEYFENNEEKVIAIYGMGEMGNRLYDELRNSGISVKYAVDKNAQNTYSEVNLIDIDDDFEEVDVMVVTATFAFDEIREELNKKADFPIVSLEDVINSL